MGEGADDGCKDTTLYTGGVAGTGGVGAVVGGDFGDSGKDVGDDTGVEVTVVRSDADNFGDDTFCRFGGDEGNCSGEGINYSSFVSGDGGAGGIEGGLGADASLVVGLDEIFIGAIGVAGVAVEFGVGFGAGLISAAGGVGGGAGGVEFGFEEVVTVFVSSAASWAAWAASMAAS
ncbi:hypothetical protein AGMMS49531_02970 [Endomicrobiia bacterium]|nr:hypothetical protein AGMMS49531_02970 [Endomicrobiia bacterium]